MKEIFQLDEECYKKDTIYIQVENRNDLISSFIIEKNTHIKNEKQKFYYKFSNKLKDIDIEFSYINSLRSITMFYEKNTINSIKRILIGDYKNHPLMIVEGNFGAISFKIYNQNFKNKTFIILNPIKIGYSESGKYIMDNEYLVDLNESQITKINNDPEDEIFLDSTNEVIGNKMNEVLNRNFDDDNFTLKIEQNT